MVDITNKEIFEAIKAQGEEAIATDQVEGAFAFVRNIPRLLSSPENQKIAQEPDMVEEYLRLADRLSFVALPSLNGDEVVGLFRGDVFTGLREKPIHLVEKVRALLITIPAFESRDALRRRLREALAANEQRLGTAEISIGETKAPATIGNWIKKYDTRFGIDTVNPIDRNQFLVSDKDIQLLSELEKDMLRRLFELYEYLKLSSTSPEGLEEPVLFDVSGTQKILRNGEWEEVKLPESVEKIIDQTIRAFEASGALRPAPSAIDMSAVARASRARFEETKGDKAKLAAQLEAAFSSERAEDALAVLLLLAQLRQLDNLMEDPRFSKLVMDDLKKSGRDDNLAGIRANPTAPQYLARLLKVIIEDKLGLAHEDAIAFGSRLAKILAMEGEKYQNIIKDTKWNL